MDITLKQLEIFEAVIVAGSTAVTIPSPIGVKFSSRLPEITSTRPLPITTAVGAGANVIRLLPPLIIDESHVREAVKLLGETAAEFSQKKAAAE